jgi:acyl dehydratase
VTERKAEMGLRAKTLQVGDSRSETVIENLSRTQIVMYAGASGDYNPLHTDEIYTTKVAGYPSVFAHGMLSMGATGKLLTDWVGDGRLTKFGVRFQAQVWPGDSLTAAATVTAIREEGGEYYADFSIATANLEGDLVVSGTATARLDP